eukprot:TRINITY_DN14915_c0_g1_i3.p1 TRINITY_DN14915_c0_g1~~TRINITY_DN14915_c0_g1_i3.p1  ORF type:complete len:360 (+),score=50.71 TRINITY_DN14915_c0_g1_i3:40-1080(+)
MTIKSVLAVKLLLLTVCHGLSSGEEKNGDVKDWRVCQGCKTTLECEQKFGRGEGWVLWENDGNYIQDATRNLHLCIRGEATGCNGKTSPVGCDLSKASCVRSSALFDESSRQAPHYVCSQTAYRSAKAVNLSKRMPLALLAVTVFLSTLLVITAYNHPNKAGINHFIIATGCGVLVFSCLVFWSPFYYVGVAGVVSSVSVMMLHSIVSMPDTERKVLVKTVFFSMFLSFIPLLIVGLRRKHLAHDTHGDACSDFYDGYFRIDSLLLGPGHNKEIKFFGLCSRLGLYSSIWYTAGVVSLANRNSDLVAPVIPPSPSTVNEYDVDPELPEFVGLKVLKSPYEVDHSTI